MAACWAHDKEELHFYTSLRSKTTKPGVSVGVKVLLNDGTPTYWMGKKSHKKKEFNIILCEWFKPFPQWEM